MFKAIDLVMYEHVAVLLMTKQVSSGRNADLHSGYASFLVILSPSKHVLG
jgi:hypothetical protein